MKKLLSVAAILFSSLFFAAFKAENFKPTLYPGIMQYYKDVSEWSLDTTHVHALNNLTSFLVQSTSSSKKINLVFACSDNSFKSITAQLVLQTLIAVNKIKNINVASCGYQRSEISLQLVSIMRKHGFKVTEIGIAANGANLYQIDFSDQLAPVIAYAKNSSDSLIPQNNFFLMNMCNSTDIVCANLPGAIFNDNLSFANPETLSWDDMDKEFSTITSQMIYAFNNFKNRN